MDGLNERSMFLTRCKIDVIPVRQFNLGEIRPAGIDAESTTNIPYQSLRNPTRTQAVRGSFDEVEAMTQQTEMFECA